MTTTKRIGWISERKHVDPCTCGSCPTRPRSRPVSLVEELRIWRHHYRNDWTEQRIRSFAVAAFCSEYRRWVIWNGWRKPPNWIEGTVPYSRLWPKGRPFLLDTYHQWRRNMAEKYAEGGEEDV